MTKPKLQRNKTMINSSSVDSEPKSKSAVKRDMLALQKLGEQLVKLTLTQLNKLPLDETLLSAIRHAQNISSREAKRRQLQYIGRLMRDRDPQPIQHALAVLWQQDHATIAIQHRLEKYRDKLLAEGDAAMTEILALFPHADRQLLRQFIRKAAQEQQKQQPPRAARALFRYLRDLTNESNHHD